MHSYNNRVAFQGGPPSDVILDLLRRKVRLFVGITLGFWCRP